ncbi:TetR/AcrR family transcriptional regulator [Croceicoccus sediminis]|uniref:TetR/AcrR family transcriptional regulator n=1 Tax=Croceicoccus sediminis TaxID=2571150 RepID=UPI0014782D2C|nr:TetR family transcriptional regulator [Croceicoccus sediminis]
MTLKNSKIFTEVPSEFNEKQLALILAAEREFARVGIEQASFRRIATNAGNGNNNAVRYHFKSRAGLVLALLRYRVGQMERRRQTMLDVAREIGLLGDIPTLVRMFCVPQMDLMTESGEFPYARFLLQFYSPYRENSYAGVVEKITEEFPAVGEIRRLLILAIGGTPEWANRRLVLGFCMFQTAIAQYASAVRSGDCADTLSDLVADTLVMVSASLAASDKKDIRSEQEALVSAIPVDSLCMGDTLGSLKKENEALKDLIGMLSVRLKGLSEQNAPD